MTGSRYALNIALAAGMALSWPSDAAARDDVARAWAASCASCHGTEGRSAGAVPSIAGRSKDDLLTMLQEFKAGKRKAATIMHQYTAGYTDVQLERIADYFSRQSR